MLPDMKRLIISIIFASLLFPLQAGDYQVYGPQGGLAMSVTLPEGFNPRTGRCPMVILMHGIFSSKDFNPMPSITKGLAKVGITPLPVSGKRS